MEKKTLLNDIIDSIWFLSQKAGEVTGKLNSRLGCGEGNEDAVYDELDRVRNCEAESPEDTVKEIRNAMDLFPDTLNKDSRRHGLSLMITIPALSDETMELFSREAEENNIGLCLYDKAGYGFFWYPTLGGRQNMDDTWAETMMLKNLPDDARAAVKYASEMGADVICIDCDA